MGTRGKRPVREADHSPPSSAEAKNDGAITPLPTRLHGVVPISLGTWKTSPSFLLLTFTSHRVYLTSWKMSMCDDICGTHKFLYFQRGFFRHFNVQCVDRLTRSSIKFRILSLSIFIHFPLIQVFRKTMRSHWTWVAHHDSFVLTRMQPNLKTILQHVLVSA
jgi:hypothetical protein